MKEIKNMKDMTDEFIRIRADHFIRTDIAFRLSRNFPENAISAAKSELLYELRNHTFPQNPAEFWDYMKRFEN